MEVESCSNPLKMQKSCNFDFLKIGRFWAWTFFWVMKQLGQVKSFLKEVIEVWKRNSRDNLCFFCKKKLGKNCIIRPLDWPPSVCGWQVMAKNTKYLTNPLGIYFIWGLISMDSNNWVILMLEYPSCSRTIGESLSDSCFVKKKRKLSFSQPWQKDLFQKITTIVFAHDQNLSTFNIKHTTKSPF